MQERFPTGMKAAIYARVSTEEQREGQTIDSQVSELEHFARQQGWQITGVYKDEGWSGGVMERPELDRLRDDARRGLFSAVLINDVDRLARDVTHLGVIKRDLERRQVQVIFRKLPAENSPTQNLMVNILGSFAEFERELIADRTRRGRRYKVEVRKQYLGTKPAYGYRYIPADRAKGRPGRLEIVPEEAAIVRRMFTWVDEEGLSARKVVFRLKEQRVRPRGQADHWGRSSVLRMLRNEMYAGVWHYNKHQRTEPQHRSEGNGYARCVKSSNRKRPKTEWLPWVLPSSLRIVPRDRWERVQRQLDRNITFSPRNEKHAYLLKGLVRCGGCGAPYVGNPSHGKYYYRCLERCKKFPSIREEALNDTVWSAICGAILNPEVLVEQAKRFRESEAKRLGEQQSTAASARQALEKLGREELKILEAYRLGLISPSQLGAQLEQIKARRDALVIQQEELTPLSEASPREIEKSIRTYCREAARNLRSFTSEQRRQFLRLLIRQIVFYASSVRICGSLPIEPARESAPQKYRQSEATAVETSPGGIVTTSIDCCGHNPSSKGQEQDANFGNPAQGSSVFHLMEEIPSKPPQARDCFGRFVARSGTFDNRTSERLRCTA